MDRPDNAFYLRPLAKPKSDIWYQKSAVGHNMLANVIPRLFKQAGISGHFTNHSLRATAATRLFDAEVDEQLIMSRTGHSSNNGVRSYKHVTDQLREKTSNVLNGLSIVVDSKLTHCLIKNDTKSTVEESELKSNEMENCAPSKVLLPISFTGATNFTVNFHF